MPPRRAHPIAARPLGRGSLPVFVAALCLLLPSPGHAAVDAETPPPQGLYEGCAPAAAHEDCGARLAEIRQAGFRYVLNYSAWYGSAEEVLLYADAAAALGLQLIWPLNHPAWRGAESLGDTYPDLAGSSAHLVNPDFAGAGADLADPDFIALAISLVANHPATWGFYIGDELPAAEAGTAAALSATVRQLAPGRQQLYVARPGAALLEPFAAFADVAGVDTYPIGSGDPPVRRAARSAQAVASAAGARTAVVLQAFSWSQYRPTTAPYPDTRDLRAMRDAAIRHADPAMILWYSYQDILRSDRPRRRWQQLIRAAFAPLRNRVRRQSRHTPEPQADQPPRSASLPLARVYRCGAVISAAMAPAAPKNRVR